MESKTSGSDLLELVQRAEQSMGDVERRFVAADRAERQAAVKEWNDFFNGPMWRDLLNMFREVYAGRPWYIGASRAQCGFEVTIRGGDWEDDEAGETARGKTGSEYHIIFDSSAGIGYEVGIENFEFGAEQIRSVLVEIERQALIWLQQLAPYWLGCRRWVAYFEDQDTRAMMTLLYRMGVKVPIEREVEEYRGGSETQEVLIEAQEDGSCVFAMETRRGSLIGRSLYSPKDYLRKRLWIDGLISRGDRQMPLDMQPYLLRVKLTIGQCAEDFIAGKRQFEPPEPEKAD